METQLQKLVDSQRAFFRTHKTRQVSFRVEQLQTLRRALVENEAALVDALHADLRRSKEVTVGVELARVLRGIDHTLEHIEEWAAPTEVSGALLVAEMGERDLGNAKLVREPVGVVLVIGAFNFPLDLSIHPALSALAAGCTVVLKPSELAAHTAQVIANLVAKNFDPAYLACVQGDVSVAQALTSLRWDRIFYTGSPRVGKIIMAAAARHLTPVTLELGGKNPLILAADADVERCARALVRGKFLNAGQVCLMTDYVLLVGDSGGERRARFARSLKAAIEGAFGERAQASSQYGRIINTMHWDRLQDLINKTQGTPLYTPADANQRDDLYIAPHVFAVDKNDVLMEDEIFGPILSVVDVASIDDAIELVNSKEKPLALYLFTLDATTQRRVIEETSSGGVTTNATLLHASMCDLPFGGVGNSGIGRCHGRYGFDEFTHLKPVVTAKM